MQVLVRPARPSDAEAIVAIFNPIIEAGCYSAFDTPFSVAAEREFIERLPARGLFHVAVQRPRDLVVGFQSLTPFAGYTHAFDHVAVMGTYVALDCRRQGVARRLFQATFAAARALGYLKLFTYVRADNPGALAAYRSQGFRVVGTAERHARVGERYVDEVVIERML